MSFLLLDSSQTVCSYFLFTLLVHATQSPSCVFTLRLLKWATFVSAVRFCLIFYNFPRQIHQSLAKCIIICQFIPLFYDSWRADILPTPFRYRCRVQGRDSALKLRLLTKLVRLVCHNFRRLLTLKWVHAMCHCEAT